MWYWEIKDSTSDTSLSLALSGHHDKTNFNDRIEKGEMKKCGECFQDVSLSWRQLEKSKGHLIKNLLRGWFCVPVGSRCQLLFTECRDHLWGGDGLWKGFEGEAKQLVFEVAEKQQLAEGGIERGELVKMTGQENDPHSSWERLHLSKSEKKGCCSSWDVRYFSCAHRLQKPHLRYGL